MSNAMMKSFSSTIRILAVRSIIKIPNKCYAIGESKRPKAGQSIPKVKLPPETNTKILHDYVSYSHPMKENRQDIKIGEDSEYPDWLWTLRTGSMPALSEMDPNSREYLKYHRKLKRREERRLMSITALKS